jgi:hypothetical protein
VEARFSELVRRAEAEAPAYPIARSIRRSTDDTGSMWPREMRERREGYLDIGP